ncbi:MAG: TRAP transporter small permease subunit [Spirochaetales bacterium]|jgi:TRAP-type C4-dicarboxylate transport system permease small subunit|nr:TRAP transporter small permease subunit [Spirochaetales bacterium]
MSTRFTKAARAVENCIGGLVVITVCLVTYGVAARMLNIAVAWTDELLRAIFIWTIFIAAAIAYKTGNLISFDLLEEMLTKHPSAGKALKLIQHAGAIVFSVFLSIQTFTIVSTQLRTNEFSPVLHIPLWLINLGCFIGSVLIFLFTLEKILRLFLPHKPQPPE